MQNAMSDVRDFSCLKMFNKWFHFKLHSVLLSKTEQTVKLLLSFLTTDIIYFVTTVTSIIIIIYHTIMYKLFYSISDICTLIIRLNCMLKSPPPLLQPNKSQDLPTYCWPHFHLSADRNEISSSQPA